MKKTIFLTFVSVLFFAACTEKPTDEDTSRTKRLIVGCWQVTDMFEETQHGIYHEDLDYTYIYNFQASGDLVVTIIEDSATVSETNGEWVIRNDTLIMYRHREAGEEHGMPAVMLIQSITEQDMRWYNLIAGESYIDLTRL